MRTALLAALTLALLAFTPGSADAQAEARLFVREHQGEVRAALELELEPGWHLYHNELGHPEAVGKPTKVTLGGEGIRWSALRYPEPHRLDQSVFGEGVFILAYEDTVVFWAAGRLDAGVSAEGAVAGVSMLVDGLICEDEGMCIPFKRSFERAGEGSAALWQDFPADLVAPAAPEGTPVPEVVEEPVAPPVETAPATIAPLETMSSEKRPTLEPPAPAVALQEPAAATTTETHGVPTADERRGMADASLYLRFEGDQVRAAIEIQIEDGWHLYHAEKGNPLGIGKPTRIHFQGEGVTWGVPVWPEPEEIDQSDIVDGAWIWGHEGWPVVYATGVIDSALGATEREDLAKRLWVEIDGQTCAESCIPYAETVVNRGRGRDDLWEAFPVAEAPEPAEGDESTGGSEREIDEPDAAASGYLGQEDEAVAATLEGGEETDDGLGAFLIQAVLWGLITLLMPCTYPMIPITISFFTKQAEARGGKVLPLSLTYGAGIVLVFILIGVVVGQVIVPFAQHPVTNLVIGALFFYFALVLFGFVTLQPPRFLMNVAGQASMKGGYAGVFLMGTTLVVTSFTCTAPFVGTLLAQGAQGGDLLRVVIGMSVFGATMAIPFVILSLVPNKLRTIPQSGSWMNTLKVTLGFVELAAAFKFFSNSDLGWEWDVISREFFLALWAVIFVAAAVYLFGLGQKGAQVGMGRRGSGVLFLLLAAYCGWGLTGKRMDFIMTSIAPPYSGGRFFPMLYEFGGEWTLLKDDYELARRDAIAADKLLFVNFTGFT